MLFIRRSKKQRKRQSAWLYSTVFHGAFSTFLILILLVSFFIQPFHKAIAAEPFVGEEETAPVVEEVKEQVSEPEPEPKEHSLLSSAKNSPSVHAYASLKSTVIGFSIFGKSI